MGRLAQRIGVVALGVALACNQERGPSRDDAPIRIDVERFRVNLRADDHALGGQYPLVTVVLFSDYACGPCSRTWKVMDDLVEDYGDDIRVVFRAMTVPGFERGEQAIEAAFVAGRQGKFWEMHRRLLADQHGFERPMLRAHAEALGLDVERFLDDIDTGAEAGRATRDRREARRLGLRAAPVAFVNGLAVVGFRDESMWHGLLDEEIKRARQMMREGTPRAKLYEAFMATASSRSLDEGKEAKDLRQKLAENLPAADLPAATPDQSKRYAVPPDDAPALGPADAPVVVVEFVDFQCPYCKKAGRDALPELRKRFPEDVRIVIRHLPLELHSAARAAARASVAAANQGKFWDFHDRLVSHEGTLGRSTFVDIARDLGLDVDRFQRDLDDPKTDEVVARDIKLARRLGVTGTPSFFINGRFQRGFRSAERLAGLVESELKRAREKRREGVRRADLYEALMADAVPESEFPNP
jgi:protein-disulfide isomerase